MGFFVKDLFVQRVPKFTWRDPLTNPPTIPETSPIIQVAALSPNVAVARRGAGGGAALPADDNTLFTVPSWLSPIIAPGGRLQESDLTVVRETLVDHAQGGRRSHRDDAADRGGSRAPELGDPALSSGTNLGDPGPDQPPGGGPGRGPHRTCSRSTSWPPCSIGPGVRRSAAATTRVGRPS